MKKYWSDNWDYYPPVWVTRYVIAPIAYLLIGLVAWGVLTYFGIIPHL